MTALNGSMRAVVLQEDRTVKVEQRPIPTPGPKEILLKVITVGQNPADWKFAQFLSPPGLIMGSDFVGMVHSWGSEVPSVPSALPSNEEAGRPTVEKDVVQKGQIRFGFVLGGYVSPKTGVSKGAFAEYIAVPWDLTGLVPEQVSVEQAASIPAPFATAVQALHLRLKVPDYHPGSRSRFDSKGKNENGEWILIWSGSTAVGQYAIQLAKLAGFRVATTASPRRWEMLKKFGADVIVDYKDPDVVKKLKEGTNDTIQYGLDCISEHGSTQTVQEAFRHSGGHLITTQFDLRNLVRPEVHTEPVHVGLLLGEDQQVGETLYKTSEEERATYVKWLRMSWELFAKELIKPLDIEVLGGLEDVQKGFDLMKEGKNKCKIVYRVFN